MRITDYVSDILEKLPNILDEAEQFRNDYRLKHKEILTKEEAQSEEYAPLLEALGIELADFDVESNLETDELTGKQGIPFYKAPSEVETIASLFPKIWKAARPTVTDLCALLIISDSELEEHDRKGAVKGLIKDRSHWLRYNASLEELFELVAVGLVLVKEQVDSASSSLGKVSKNMSAMLGTAQTDQDETDQDSASPDSKEEQR